MAVTPRSRGRVWSRLHFLIRFLGLSGVLAVGIGAVLVHVLGLWPTIERAWRESWQALWEQGQSWIRLGAGSDTATVAVYLVAGGLAAALVALLIELLGGLWMAAGRRSAVGSNALVQTGLVLALVFGVNYVSFGHYRRHDLTRDRKFTLSDELQEKLRRLQPERGQTTIVVYVRSPADEDAYLDAAQNKVVEKVMDLVEQLREFGARFRVEVLHRKDADFDDRLELVARQIAQDQEEPATQEQERERRVTARAKLIQKAIDETPESHLFFYGRGRGSSDPRSGEQRLSFKGFYQLDKKASRAEKNADRNLVLLSQGQEPFIRKVLNIGEARPRIAIGVPHEVLGTGGSPELGMAGLRKVLTERGMEVQDIILKKWSETGPPEPAAFTADEYKLEQIDEQVRELEANIKSREEELKTLQKLVKEWETAPLDELAKGELARDLGIKRLNENLRKEVLAKILTPNVGVRQYLNEDDGRDLSDLRKQRAGVQQAEDSLAEKRRITDLRAKTERLLAESDLLILPRMTLFNVARGERIGNWVYRLDQAQSDAVQAFLKAGKPVLVCLGPVNEPAGGRPDPMDGPDRLEDLLRDLGFRLPKQTILFNVESKSFAERRSGIVIMGTSVEVPPVKFDFEPGAGLAGKTVTANLKPNPLQESLRSWSRGLGKNQVAEVRLRHPRPIYYDATQDGARQEFDPTIMLTDERSWNEKQPFPTRERTPRYEPPKGDDAGLDAFERSRLGPFPIGAIAQRRLPESWYEGDDAKPATVRVAALGHGGVFMEPKLSPMKEKLLLDTTNWLLGRDDLLTSGTITWQYPRVAVSERDQQLWLWGTRLGMPLAFGYLGFLVLLVRRLR